MHPMSRLVSWAIVSLVFSLPISVVMEGGGRGAIGQDSITKKKAGGDQKAKDDYLVHKKYYNTSRFLSKQVISQNDNSAYQLLSDGIQLQEKGDFKSALEKFQLALLITRQNKDQSLEATALHNIGLLYVDKKEYDKALNFLKDSLAILKTVDEPGKEGITLQSIAWIYRQRQEIEISLKFYQEAFDAFRRSIANISPANDQEEAKSLSTILGSITSIGNIYVEENDYEKALEIFQVAALGFKRINVVWVNQGSVIGFVYEATGKYAQALANYQDGLELCEKFEESWVCKGQLLNKIGVIYLRLGRVDKALTFFEQALPLYTDAQKDDKGRIRIKYRFVRHREETRREIKEGVWTIQEDERAREGLSATLNNIALAYRDKGDNIAALDFLINAVLPFAIYSSRAEEVHGITLTNIGYTYYRLEDQLKAREYFQKALALSEKINDRVRQSIILFGIASVYRSEKDIPKALQKYRESLSIAQAIGDRHGQIETLGSISSLLIELQQYNQAEDSLISALKVSKELPRGLDDNNKRSILERLKFIYYLLEISLIGQNKPYQALEISEAGRARAFTELLALRQAQSIQELKRLEPLTLKQIKEISRLKNSTLVEYSLSERLNANQQGELTLNIYVVQPDGSIQFRQANLTALGKSLADFVNASRDGLGVRGRDEEARILITMSPEKQRELQEKRDRSLRQLHQLLIEPIADLLPKDPNQRVVFLPQGELFLVPFPALLNAQNQPLITQHTILTAPSIQTLDLTHKAAQSLPKGDRPALVVGNPTMPAITTVIGDPPKKLTALPGAEKEAKAIAAQLNTQAITGAKARKAAIVQQMQTAGIIHLATHGLLDSFKGDAPGAIALAPNGTQEPNDGLLTTREIFDLKLTADLVVLSACDTGRGDISGDGVIGLSRSLFVAGVPSVIVSLWKVPDESTAFLMTEFYKNWKERKLDKAQALRQAMLTTRDKYPQPLDWAAFTLIGEAE
jgi:CHAT domain-containing protein/tetratricopeptide (TPR) repeat protein